MSSRSSRKLVSDRMAKKPSFQFYPGDWKKDPAVQGCSFAARGLWFEMLIIMFEAQPRGYLTATGAPMTEEALARIAGGSVVETKRCLAELKKNTVFSVDDNGLIFSRRLLRDEQISSVRSAAGKMGGRPITKQDDLRKLTESKTESKTKRRASPRTGAVEAEVEVEAEVVFSEGVRGNPERAHPPPSHSLISAYDRLIEQWPNPTDTDLGAQVWISLVDSREITESNLDDIFHGLERWKQSDQWASGKQHSVPTWLGYSKDGKPSGKRWKDFPRAVKAEETFD